MVPDFTLPTLPPREVLLACALAAIAISTILAACFALFLALCSEWFAATRKRGFYTRFAQQASQMAILLGLLALALFAAATAHAVTQEPALLQFPYILPLATTGGAAGVTFLLFILYVAVRPQKGVPGFFHHLTGGLAGCAALISLFLATGLTRHLMRTMPEIASTLPVHQQLMDFFTIPLDSIFWYLLMAAIPTGFAFAAAIATLWLLAMRERQDYGRDYYAFALPYCARWALVGTLVAIPASAFAFFQGAMIMLPELSRQPSLLLDSLAVVFPLLACLLWTLVIRSPHPMRRKISVITAYLFLLAGFAGHILMFNKIVPSP